MGSRSVTLRCVALRLDGAGEEARVVAEVGGRTVLDASYSADSLGDAVTQALGEGIAAVAREGARAAAAPRRRKAARRG